MRGHVRQVRVTGSGVEVTRSDVLSGDGVRVMVTSAGICGSDLHTVRLGSQEAVLGHEFGGHLEDGTLVAVRPTLPCGSCPLCVNGIEQQCRQIRTKMYGATLDGGFADEVMVDASCLVPVSADVDPSAVALVEPLAVAIHAANRVVAGPGERLMIVGGGSIGLACAAVLIERGFIVDVSARHPAQQHAALTLGAGIEPGRHYSAVIDAAGTSSSLSAAALATRPGGQIVLVAAIWEPVDYPALAMFKEVSVTPAMMYGTHEGVSEFSSAAAFIARNPTLPDVLVTHRFSLDRVAEAFRVASDRGAGAIKVLLLPNST